MGNRGIAGVYLRLVVLSSIAGCSGVEEFDAEVTTSAQAAVGVDEYLYLRCNATGWGADGATLLTPDGRAGVYALEYGVSADYMVSGGDQCVITRTNARNGWGSANASFGGVASGVVTVPGRWSIGAANSAPVTVRYPALGRYRATVDWATGTVSIAAAGTTPPAPSDYYYLRCNATSWNVEGANRFATAADGPPVTYAVNQPWMVWGGDQCVVTRTNRLDGWGTSQATLGTATATTLTVRATGSVTTSLVPAGQAFTVRYPALGRYQATFDPTTGRLSIGVPGPSVPETGLHGRVESLGNNRVRVTYDFQTAEQLSDFVSTDTHSTAVSLVDGRLVVQNLGAPGVVNAATLIKGFRIDSLRYQAELLAGDHINVYVGTIWNGSWIPRRGYAAIHRADGRLLGANGHAMGTADGTAVEPGTRYRGRIDTTERGLTWTLDGQARTLTFPYYGGTTRTLALGGFGSTTAFDNLVLEGTVQGMESDGTETNPGVIHGRVDNLPGGRVRITYDFSDPQQKYDFVVNSTAGTRREMNDGRLIVGHVSDASVLKVALSKYRMRVDRLTYRAESLSGDHINVYWNTTWDERWAPRLGCGGIHRQDGRLFVVNGAPASTSDGVPLPALTSCVGDFLQTDAGLSWTLNGITVALDTPCNSGIAGTLGLGSYASDAAFDDVTIEGQLE